MESDILYLNEHTSCRHYVSDYRCSFTCREVKSGGKLDLDRRSNLLVFVIEGAVTVDHNEFTGRRFAGGDMLFIPQLSSTKFTADVDSRIVACVYDVVNVGSVCDKFEMTSYCALKKEIEYDFRPIRIIPQIGNFLDQLVYFLEQGVKCEHYHLLKQKELFLILRWFYTKEQLTELFWPVLGYSFDFRTFVVDNYMKVGDIKQFAGLAAMGSSRFHATFKKEFGMSPKKWILEQKAKHIKHALSEPEANLNNIMMAFGFNSPTHFTRFCKHHLGCCPTEMKAKLTSEERKMD